MLIKEMMADDLEQVAKLCVQLGYPNTLADLAARFSKISRSDDCKLFVAKMEHTILGFVQVNRESTTLVAGARAEVSALVVDESARGKGIGKALMQKAEAWARAQGVHLIRIRSNVIREQAHRFYEGVGYRNEKSWHLFVKEI